MHEVVPITVSWIKLWVSTKVENLQHVGQHFASVTFILSIGIHLQVLGWAVCPPGVGVDVASRHFCLQLGKGVAFCEVAVPPRLSELTRLFVSSTVSLVQSKYYKNTG